ncbi:MAG: hypothetical protein AABY84_10030 [Candidatus Firestonebacteria bacterium]
MDKKGEVIWHKSFPFSNGGEPKDKFLILLNTPDKEEPFLFALTTSKPKTQTLGCHSDKGYFVIEGGKEKVFPKRTWVKLFDIQEFDGMELLKRSLQLKQIIHKESLSEQTINEIVNCIKRCIDVPQNYKLIICKK